MAREIIIAGNWKMNTTLAEAKELASSIARGLDKNAAVTVLVFPPSPYVCTVAETVEGTSVHVGMQNMYFEEKGAFTGEVSPLMVKDCGCNYVLLGHSERRHVLGETDELIHKKCLAAYKNGLKPMLCVGELLDEREKGKTEDIIKRQIESAFDNVLEEDASKCVIAYEPVWAIGTGKVATPDIAQDVHAYIRSLIKDLYGESLSSSISILYGGSVKPENAAGLIALEDVDGVLVGGASLQADSFLEIIKPT